MFFFVFLFFILKPARIYEGVFLSLSPSTLFTFHHNNETRSRWCVKKQKQNTTKNKTKKQPPELLGGPAPGPVLIWVESTDQALDALQLVGGVFLRASFWGHGNRAGGYGGGVTGHLWCGIQSDSRHGAGRDDAVPLQLAPAAGHGGHGGSEQGAVRCRHGEGVGAVPESGTHCVQEGMPVHRRGGSGGGCRGCCHVRVRIGEQTAKRGHGNALWRNKETDCEPQSWCRQTDNRPAIIHI